MKTLKLFFSWQSDIKSNHYKIRNILTVACDAIRKEGKYDIKYIESTWERSGSPIIEKAVIENVKQCDIFVADLTPIEITEKKCLPNPNVMLELGVAKSRLIDDVILLLYTGAVDLSKMPFDINHQRLSSFSESTITNYVRAMAETAIKNPKQTSVFDNNDTLLYFDRNVKKNIVSGKYLPDVYLDNREVKQHLRDFVAPLPFCKLVLERCDMIDTYRTNKNRQLRHEESFVFDVSPYKDIPSEEQLSVFYNRTNELKAYLKGKYEELHGCHDYLCSRKYGQQFQHLEYITGKLLLITTYAGQGKTNLICDLVDNVLLKRDIPFVYLNGYEINANNIGNSFSRIVLPTSDDSFDSMIQGMATYCRYKRSPIILIIDGLNENQVPDDFARNLEVFLEAVLQYDCVKVIMTCRTEYYKDCFATLDTLFDGRLLKIENLNKHLDNDEKDRLLKNYIRYFNISVNFDSHVKDQLCNDLLLLRIFCEANQNKTLGFVHTIKREELFTEYYELMTKNLIEKVRLEEKYTLSPYKVRDFIMRLIEYMIANKQFFNVPLSYLESKLNDEEKKVFSRFLDENILLRKDLTLKGKGLFGRNEVVNFTYDAFRDYLLSSYLCDELFVENRQSYDDCVLEFTRKGHQLREGITPFLFVHAKNSNNETAIKFYRNLDWYKDIFELYIWDVPEDSIVSEDIDLIKEILDSEDPVYVATRLICYSRWIDSVYPKLGIRLLLDYLSNLDDKELPVYIEKVWSDKVVHRWGRPNEKSSRTQMLDFLKNVLSNEMVCSNPCFHNLFELLLYIAICSDEYAWEVFKMYYSKYRNEELLDKVSLSTKCSALVEKIAEVRKAI